MASKSEKLPAFQFYPGDWRKDPGVQSLSFHDRGVWFEILCLMHESSERGRLLLNGNPMPEDALSRLLGLDKQRLVSTLRTLITTGVAETDDAGALINRRMLRDERLRVTRASAGRLGGNPVLLKQKPTTQVKQNPTPSSSSSSSSSKRTEKPPDGGSSEKENPAFVKAVCDLGIEIYLGPKQRSKVRSLFEFAGDHAFRAAFSEPHRLGINGGGAITYAEKIIMGNKAKERLSSGRNVSAALAQEDG